MLSYWEKKNFLNHDLIVVGSGFTGLSAAIHFKKEHPKSSILIIERGFFPTGASTKNAGFACFGSLTEILADFWTMSPDEVFNLVERRYRGIKEIRKQFGDKALDYQHHNGYELLDQEGLKAIDQLEETNRFLRKIFKKDVFSQVKNPLKFGFSNQVKAVVKNKFEGELDPARYIDSLWQNASKLGVKIITGVAVEEIDRDEGIVWVKSVGGENKFEFRAASIILCTNAFTKKLWEESPIQPGRGLVLISKPLQFEIPWKGAFHLDEGYVYFRQIDGRLLIGGGRNKDFEKENTLDFGVNPTIKAYLEDLVKKIIFPDQEVKWESEWTGIMAFGPKKTPVIQQIGKKTVVAVRMGGMGVALSWQAGKEVCTLASEM